MSNDFRGLFIATLHAVAKNSGEGQKNCVDTNTCSSCGMQANP